MKLYSSLSALLLIASFVLAPSLTLAAHKEKGFSQVVSAEDVKEAYKDGKLRVLIMPGHEPLKGGAVFQGVYEREIVVDIAQELAKELQSDPNIEVIIARDDLNWHADIERYFDKNMRKIERFVSSHKKDMEKKVKRKEVTQRDHDGQVPHAKAPDDVALRLYGINKWANENDIDLILNLHINDAPDHGPNDPGANSGYAIYIPDAQFGNGKASRPIAEAIAERLNDMAATSTLRIENQGVVEDQTLIAVGSNNTLEVPTALIEYGYITESKFLVPELRGVLAKDFAHQTHIGLKDFLGVPVTAAYPTKTLPRTWSVSPTMGSTTPETYALQTALRILGFYPPSESTLVECPISGTMNECTEVAIKAYQRSLGYTETGGLGPKTRAALNARFGY